MTNQKSIDTPSISNLFGWERIGNEEFAIPVIIRNNGIRYSPVRIVEQEIIKKYDALPQSIFQCITLKSFYLTAQEAKHLNNINFNHCNSRYGEAFFSTKDVIISAADVRELSRFLNVSHKIFTENLSQFGDKLGVLKFTMDPNNPSICTMLVPYIGKVLPGSNGKPVRFIPSKLVDSYLRSSANSVQASPSDWDVMYLKMLSIYCGSNSQQLITRDSSIILLDGLIYIKTSTPVMVEEYCRPQTWNAS